MRAGPRSQQTPLSLAVIDVLNRHLEESPLRSVHGLSQVVPTVSRSQLYLLLRGQAVIDVAELFAICEALGVTPRQVIEEPRRPPVPPWVRLREWRRTTSPTPSRTSRACPKRRESARRVGA